ncbi:unnamed protein product [Closterium sp. NIES-54]
MSHLRWGDVGYGPPIVPLVSARSALALSGPLAQCHGALQLLGLPALARCPAVTRALAAREQLLPRAPLLPASSPCPARHCCLQAGLYTLTTASAQVAESGQVAVSSRVSASGLLAASCSCRVLSHQTLLWHHRLGHPSLPRLRSMHSRLLVSGLPKSLPSLPCSPSPLCLPYVEGRQRAAPQSSEFPPTTSPLQTLCQNVIL